MGGHPRAAVGPAGGFAARKAYRYDPLTTTTPNYYSFSVRLIMEFTFE
jgi:hypothetical protein